VQPVGVFVQMIFEFITSGAILGVSREMIMGCVVQYRMDGLAIGEQPGLMASARGCHYQSRCAFFFRNCRRVCLVRLPQDGPKADVVRAFTVSHDGNAVVAFDSRQQKRSSGALAIGQ